MVAESEARPSGQHLGIAEWRLYGRGLAHNGSCNVLTKALRSTMGLIKAAWLSLLALAVQCALTDIHVELQQRIGEFRGPSNHVAVI